MPGWTDHFDSSTTCSSLSEEQCNEDQYTYFDKNLIYAVDACCCFGIRRNSNIIESTDPNEEFLNSCADIQLPRPWPKYNCDWFSMNPDQCTSDDHVNSVLLKLNGVEFYPRDVCCACRLIDSSSSSNLSMASDEALCNDYPGWYDSHPAASFSCKDYKEHEACHVDGGKYVNFGHNANSACCICGGGIRSTDSANSGSSKEVLVLPSSNASCVDELEWVDNTGQYNCNVFVQKYNGYPDVSQCLSYGHFTTTSGINATTACCSCHYGYDVVHGGGYRGSLLGKILRFGVTTYTDSLAHDGSTGIIYNFMIDLASSRGFGLVQKDLTYLNDTAALEELSADTYEACMEGKLVVGA